MPDVHGNITAGDLAQGLVQEFHLRDEAVTTGKIPDLAVTFPDKIDDPIWVTTASGGDFNNETITTTPTVFGQSFSIAVPAWVDQVSVLAIGHFQLTNTSGGDVLMSCGVEIDGEVTGGFSHEAVNNQTQVMAVSRSADLIGLAGSSFTVQMECSISTGTNTSNVGRVRALVIGTR